MTGEITTREKYLIIENCVKTREADLYYHSFCNLYMIGLPGIFTLIGWRMHSDWLKNADRIS